MPPLYDRSAGQPVRFERCDRPTGRHACSRRRQWHRRHRLLAGGWHRPLAGLMLRHIGLPASAMRGELDRLYAERVLQLLRASSIGAAVILAHDQVYDEHGKVIEGVGSFYVPNDYVLKLARDHPQFLAAV